jgi:hypothetical protein
MTTQAIVGPWVFQVSIGRRNAARGNEVSTPTASRNDRLGDTEARSLGASDAELIHLSRTPDLDGARRRWQIEASALGIRF